MKRACLLAIASVAFLGCFPALEEDPNFPSYFTKKLPGDTIQARLDGERMYGADVELRKQGSAYRGNSSMGVIDLRASEAPNGGVKIEGDIGNGRTELYVTESPDGLSGQGLVSGAMSHFDLTETQLSGTIGSCVYDLRMNPPNRPYYAGMSRCGLGGRVKGGGTRVALPAAFSTLPLDERAIFLAVFLGS